MSRNPNRGRVYRRCGCRDAAGRQLGAACPALAQRRHGRWAFAVDLPALDRRRKTLRRGGFATQSAARSALHQVLACERAGVHGDDRQTVADYLNAWIDYKAHTLKPTIMARYHDYVVKDLSPCPRRDPARGPHPPPRRRLGLRATRGRTRTGHRPSLRRDAVQRARRRRPSTPPPA